MQEQNDTVPTEPIWFKIAMKQYRTNDKNCVDEATGPAALHEPTFLCKIHVIFRGAPRIISIQIWDCNTTTTWKQSIVTPCIPVAQMKKRRPSPREHMLVMRKEGPHRGGEEKKRTPSFSSTPLEATAPGIKKDAKLAQAQSKGPLGPEIHDNSTGGARMEVRVQRFFISRSGDQKLHGRKKKVSWKREGSPMSFCLLWS